jgi:uncharacterized protein YegL
MPKLGNVADEMGVNNITGPGNFQFSAVRVENLGATEYTLVTVVVDTTGSVYEFKDELSETIKSIVTACQSSPRQDNLLIRVVTFDYDVDELHGFKELSTINVDGYNDLNIGGMTALYDATGTCIDATTAYAHDLVDQDFDVNSIIFIITDGVDNASKFHTPNSICSSLKQVRRDEEISDMTTILIGLTDNNDQIKTLLENFATEADLTDFIDVGEANASTLARVASFVSKSISSQSQSLAGGVSVPVTF